MTFSNAPLGVNLLDGLYAALVAFVLCGVVFAILRLLPRPGLVRRRSVSMLAVKSAGFVLLIAGSLAFGASYAGLVSF